MIEGNVLRPQDTITFNTENSPSQKSCKARPEQKTKSALKSPQVQPSTSKNIICNSDCSQNSDDIFKLKDDSQLGNSAQSSSDVYIPPSGVQRHSMTQLQISTKSTDDSIAGIFSKMLIDKYQFVRN